MSFYNNIEPKLIEVNHYFITINETRENIRLVGGKKYQERDDIIQSAPKKGLDVKDIILLYFSYLINQDSTNINELSNSHSIIIKIVRSLLFRLRRYLIQEMIIAILEKQEEIFKNLDEAIKILVEILFDKKQIVTRVSGVEADLYHLGSQVKIDDNEYSIQQDTVLEILRKTNIIYNEVDNLLKSSGVEYALQVSKDARDFSAEIKTYSNETLNKVFPYGYLVFEVLTFGCPSKKVALHKFQDYLKDICNEIKNGNDIIINDKVYTERLSTYSTCIINAKAMFDNEKTALEKEELSLKQKVEDDNKKDKKSQWSVVVITAIISFGISAFFYYLSR